MSSIMLMPRLTFTDSMETMMADHSNQLPPEYDDIHPPHYDPSFTAHVSTSMRVPDRIAVASEQDGGDAQVLLDQYNIGRSAVDMNVPDKIIVAGQEKHIGMKEDMRLNLDFNPADSRFNPVAIQTPPRVLTLEDRPFPSVAEELQNRPRATPRQFSQHHNGVILPASPSIDLSSSMDGLLLQDSDVDDSVVIRRQLIRLTRRLMHLEEEHLRRSQREMVMYPVIIGYVLFQFAKWFLRNN